MDITGGNMIIRVDKEVDHCEAEKIKVQFDKYYSKGCIRNVIFDMSAVDFMDSSGIGMIMGRYAKLCCIDGKVYVAAVKKHIDKLLAMAGVYKYVIKCDNVIQAVNIANKNE